MLSSKDPRWIRALRNFLAIRDVPQGEDDGLFELSFNLNDPTSPESYRPREEFLAVAAVQPSNGAGNSYARCWQPSQQGLTILRRIIVQNNNAAAAAITFTLTKATVAAWGGPSTNISAFRDTRFSLPMSSRPSTQFFTAVAAVAGADMQQNLGTINLAQSATFAYDVPFILSLGPDGNPWGIEVTLAAAATGGSVIFEFVELTPNVVERNLAG